jgi:signal transduction histidine kinase
MNLRTTLQFAFVLISLLSSGISALIAFSGGRDIAGQLVAGTLFVSLAAIAGTATSRRITRPLADLARTIDDFGAGDFSRRADFSSADELCKLARSFNQMADTLSAKIAERLQVEEHLHRSRAQFRDLSGHLQRVREEERARIARDIHDDLGQCLTTIKLDLAILYRDTPEQAAVVRQKVREMSHLVDGTIHSVRRIITELRPRLLDDLGLTAAIEWQTADFQKRTGIPVSLSVYPREIILDRDRSTVLFRVLQEALLNVVRHAAATAVSVSLTDIDGKVEFEVRDNGRGITTEESGHRTSFGLLGIRERAESLRGTVSISGKPGEGTLLTITFPTTDEEAQP